MRYIIFYLIVAVMSIFTLIGFLPNFNKPFFIGGSNDSVSQIITAKPLTQFFLLILSIYLLYRVFGRLNVLNISFFALAFFLWFTSGRTIGVLPNGKIKTGWFYFEIKEIDLCTNTETDCETITNYQTQTNGTFFWIMEVKNKQTENIFFVGPIIWQKVLKVFEKEFGAGKFLN